MKLTKKLLTSAILGFLLASFHSTAWADTVDQQLQKALDAAEKGDYHTVLKFVQPLAEQGYPNYQILLGVMYEKGQGVKQNYFEAVKWYRKAAEQGNASAQFNLGDMYREGQGVKQDYFEAMKWYRKAAEQGVLGAQVNLGVMYDNGYGVKQNRTLAKEWFGKACDNGEQQGCEYYDKLNRGK